MPRLYLYLVPDLWTLDCLGMSVVGVFRKKTQDTFSLAEGQDASSMASAHLLRRPERPSQSLFSSERAAESSDPGTFLSHRIKKSGFPAYGKELLAATGLGEFLGVWVEPLLGLLGFQGKHEKEAVVCLAGVSSFRDTPV